MKGTRKFGSSGNIMKAAPKCNEGRLSIGLSLSLLMANTGTDA